MSDSENDPVVELRREIGELKQALQDLQNAKPAEVAEARADVAEAEQDVAAAAKAAGLRPEQYRRAIDAAKAAQFEEENGPAIRRIVSQEMQALMDAAEAEAIEDEAEADSKASAPLAEPKGKGGKPKAGKATTHEAEKPEQAEPPEPPAPDDGPVHEHWADQSVSELLRR